jgi:hypothetical protein
MERSGDSTHNKFSTMPRTPHAPINQRPPQLQLNSSNQPTTTTATATRCQGPHTHQSTNHHRSFNWIRPTTTNQPTTTSTIRCRGPHTHQSINDHHSYNYIKIRPTTTNQPTTTSTIWCRGPPTHTNQPATTTATTKFVRRQPMIK